MKRAIHLLASVLLISSTFAEKASPDMVKAFLAAHESFGKQSERLFGMIPSAQGADQQLVLDVLGISNEGILMTELLLFHLATVSETPAKQSQTFNSACKSVSQELTDGLNQLNRRIPLAKSPGLVAEMRDLRKLIEMTIKVVDKAGA